MNWKAIAETIARRRQEELREEAKERLMFNDYAAIQKARAAASAEAMARAAQGQRIPYQLEIPGVGATLMSLRYREPLTPEEAYAMGLVPPMEQRSAPPVGQQLELDLNGKTRSRIVPFQRGSGLVAPEGGPVEPERMAGERLMRALALASLASGAGVGSLAEMNDPDGSQF